MKGIQDIAFRYRKGFVAFSSSMVVSGPCPGNTFVELGKVNIFSLMPLTSRSMFPSGKVSSTNATCKEGVTTKNKIVMDKDDTIRRVAGHMF